MSARDQIEPSLGRVNYDRALAETESARNWVKRELQKIKPDFACAQMPDGTTHQGNFVANAEAAIEAYTVWSRRLYMAAFRLCDSEQAKESDLTWEMPL